MPTVRPLSGIYANSFESAINIMCSPANIHATAQRFIALEQSKPYSFGEFAKSMLPNRNSWGVQEAFDDWEKNVNDIPVGLRQKLTDTIRNNLNATPPLPMLLKVGDNVDQTHDLIVKYLSINYVNYIGILMLCPNPHAPPP